MQGSCENLPSWRSLDQHSTMQYKIDEYKFFLLKSADGRDKEVSFRAERFQHQTRKKIIFHPVSSDAFEDSLL